MSPTKTKTPVGYYGGSTGKQKKAIVTIPGTTDENNYQKAIDFVTSQAAYIDYGIITLRLHVESGKLTRYTVNTERSFLAGGDHE
jgi:hypothetical protein